MSELAVPWLAVIAGVYAGMSVVAFVLYAADKRAAKRHASRTPEATLLLVGFLGGWPGGLAARHVFRHKTIKQPFRTMFWVTVVANLGLMVALAVAANA